MGDPPTQPSAGPHGAAEAPGPGGRFAGLSVPDPRFAADDGSADPALRQALAGSRRSAADHYAIVAALAAARLLVPVVAVLDEAAATPAGLRHEKSSHMASVSVAGRDGRRGLLGFTGVDALAAWDPQARPVPATTTRVAQAAIEEGADALVVDVAGPHPYVLDGPALRATAEGRTWRAPYDDPDVRAAVLGALGPLLRSAGVGVRLDPPPPMPADGAPTDFLVVLLPGAQPAGAREQPDLAALARAAADALAGDPVLRARLVHGLALAVDP